MDFLLPKNEGNPLFYCENHPKTGKVTKTGPILV